jgi:hypothetical protein
MIWEGKKGEPSEPVMPLDLNVRPILDGNYIIPKTVEYIKRNVAAKKPFFVYVGYSEMHPPVIGNPDFVGKSPQRGANGPTGLVSQTGTSWHLPNCAVEYPLSVRVRASGEIVLGSTELYPGAPVAISVMPPMPAER